MAHAPPEVTEVAVAFTSLCSRTVESQQTNDRGGFGMTYANIEVLTQALLVVHLTHNL